MLHLASEEMRHFSNCDQETTHVLHFEMTNATGIALLNHERKWSRIPEAMVLCHDIDELEHPRLRHHIGPCQGIGLVCPHQLLKADHVGKDAPPHMQVVRSVSQSQELDDVVHGERNPRNRRLVNLVIDPSQLERKIRQLQRLIKPVP
jgi:hypothetical protein